MELLQTLPNEADYTPLAEHQSHTPASFYSGPAVLHYVLRGASLAARPSDLCSISALAKLTGTEPSSGTTAGGDSASEAETSISGVDVWVASDKLVLARPATSLALAIPYRSIALHAVSAAGLYVQLSTDAGASGEDDEEAADTVEMTLTPATTNGAAVDGERPVDALFRALSDCADLHPDPHEEDHEDETGAAMPSFVIHGNGTEDVNGGLYQITAPAGEAGPPGLPPPMPGSGGWITAENMHEYFDEEGNWKADGPAPGMLGPGAGTVREREAEDDGEEKDNEQGEDGEEAKWQRTG